MPFTGSHPAIILPLLKSNLFSVSGLIMGSMVPDFEFFITLRSHVVHGHSFWPMFWLNLPLSLLCISMYHIVVKDQLVVNLPFYFRKRFQPFLTFDWVFYFKSNYLKVICSILIGNLSHLFMDAFTHFDGFFVQRIPLLRYLYFNIPLFDILQYGLSLAGAFYILHFIHKMPSKKVKGDYLKRNMIVYWVLVALAILLVYVLSYDTKDYENFGARIVFLCAGFLIGLFLTSLWNKIKNPKHEDAHITHVHKIKNSDEYI